ncbi:MAG: lasso peptide biosynthesis B2 protein [Sphingosinicella sp.]|uniref:lasso peptide biosynthesis B2 protein n=1 Tax=Sphingosinicella sp. TaxID=1917971 RepID=UPI004037A02C
MARFVLPPQIYYCEIGEQRIFLDLLADRYFSLPQEADRSFSTLAGGGEIPTGALDALIAAGVVARSPAGKPLASTTHVAPDRSFLEEELRSGGGLSALPEVLLLTLWARRSVRRKRLPRLLIPSAKGRAPSSEAGRERRDRAVTLFVQARRAVPVKPNCLHDSLALLQFLRRRRVHADLVIGAKLDPFGAHCWIQDGTMVLNDTLAAARGFAPILVA